jgi:hypothetical protein
MKVFAMRTSPKSPSLMFPKMMIMMKRVPRMALNLVKTLARNMCQ